MKTLILGIMLLLFVQNLIAQKIENKIKENEVPVAVINAFKSKYPTILAKQWELDNGKYEVDFYKEKIKYIAVFTVEGKWLITGTELKKEEVPKNIMDQIAAGEYKDWKYNQARSVETPELAKEIIVEVEKGNEDVMLYFDIDGKFLRAKKE